MDTGRSFLIDTNILFQLEDDRPVAAEYAEMQRRCSTHGVSLYVHEVSKLDIDRDKNASRRSISMSKLSKFQMLCGVAASSQLDLDRTFGPANDENTKVDVALLDAVRRGIVDFLVTHDEGIHRRARRAGIEDRVFRIRDAIDWLLATYEPTSVVLPYIRDAHCFNIAPHDPILATLREDYPEFDRWFRNVQKRPCWILEVGAQTEIAGVLIRKDSEPRQDTDATSPGERILKISTFKVKEEYRGERFGEHLLKQVLWYAQKNRYDVVYVTAFEEKQSILIDLLLQFGFARTKYKETGEAVYEKVMGRGPLTLFGIPLVLAKEHYPRFVSDTRVNTYVIPIQPQWHRILFPENVPPEKQIGLFDESRERTPGNTIRKVYLCRTKVSKLNPGDILLFYVSGTESFSRVIRSVGVVEKMQETRDINVLLRMTGRRSVYTEDQQAALIAEKETPVKVIDFMLAGHLVNPLPLASLLDQQILNGWPQSLVRLDSKDVDLLNLHKQLGY